MRFRYRIGKEQSKEVIATMKICERRMSELKQQHEEGIVEMMARGLEQFLQG